MKNIWISKISTNLVYVSVRSLFGSDTGICCKHMCLISVIFLEVPTAH